MTNRSRDPEGSAGADEVRALLQSEAETHHTDTDAVMARVHQARVAGASALPSEAVQRRPGLRLVSDRRPVRLAQIGGAAAAAAAAAAVIVAVALTGLPGGPDGVAVVSPASGTSRDAAVSPSSPVVGTAAATRDGTPAAGSSLASPSGPSGTTQAGAASGQAGRPGSAQAMNTMTTGSGLGSSGAVAAGAGASGASGAGTAAAATAAVSAKVHVMPLASGASVSLPATGDRDWQVVGARKDGTIIREKAGTAEITEISAQGATPSVTTSPLLMSWSGGVPEQSHTDAATWWSVPSGGTSLRIVITLTSPATIDLYVGSSGTPSTISAMVSGTTSGRPWTTSATGPGLPGGAALASVQVSGATAGATATITVTSASAAGTLSIAAVALH